MFTLRAAVMRTVNDFPAYAMVSGWSTKGYMACPVCKEDVTSGWHAGKTRDWSGDEILELLNRLDFAPFGKTKNVFDTLVGTILDIEGKTKDTIKARLDLERMGIRRGLWMNRDSDKTRRDLTFFSMKPNDKKEFLKFVSSVKFPDGYASNIARCVNVDGVKFTGLKSHDYHVFMQRLLPVGIRHLLPEDVVKPIMLLCRFFSQLTAKTLRRTDMFQLRHDIVQVLCKFEMIFPPAFFTSMMHVMVHLPEEALLAGPVNYRWMYPIERLLGELKKSVRNRAKPEGSIIEAWVQYESLTFCGMYLKDVETAFNRPQRNNDGGMRKEQLSVFSQSARPFGDPGRGESFSTNDMEVAHWFVLNNCDEIMAYLDEHEQMMKREHPSHLVARKQRELFPQWFLDSMSDLIRRGRSMTTAPSLDPPAQSASAATAPALLDHMVVGPWASQAPASSASSVEQPASARQRHRPTDTIDTTSTDSTGASGSQPDKNTRGPCRQLKTAKVTRVTNSRISIGYDERHRAAPTAELHSSLAHDIGHVVRTHCPMQWKSWRVMPDEIKVEVRGQLSTNYNLEDLDEESLTYVNRLFAERTLLLERPLVNWLEILKKLGVNSVSVMGDSMLVLKQLFGNYKVTSQALLGYHALASQLIEDFDDERLAHLPREHNTQANAMAQLASEVQISEGLSEELFKVEK
ncbi:hypothetical protein L3X38_024499 [Prunus dulcis]|uniref:DUF4218 domain-containing protein n=1 Tax=Prunus dulcis TaxID=3755 RepID=A0AAD4W2G5_PRUDU|nr:hypothetical protein L3X38_024499 [Prunus dulcis]